MTTPPTRPLSSLTEQEAKELYRIQFGTVPVDLLITRFDTTIDTGDGYEHLVIHDDGEMLVTLRFGGTAHMRAAKLIDYLDQLGVAIRGEVV